MNINELRLRKQMVIYLRGLANGSIKPENPYIGICNNFSHVFQNPFHKFIDVENYPEYSGIGTYPIKSLNIKYDAREYYKKIDNLWRGKYGKSRRHFCAWCADEIEKSMNNG